MSPTSGAETEGPYRYALWRRWALGPSLLWIMLNPSTADATTDDPTIRRVIGFSKGFGFGAAMVLNLFAYRATEWRKLKSVSDPVGPLNTIRLREQLRSNRVAVAAWGPTALAAEQEGNVCDLARADHCRFKCLGFTQRGAPRHPLFVSSSAKLVDWDQTMARKG